MAGGFQNQEKMNQAFKAWFGILGTANIDGGVKYWFNENFPHYIATLAKGIWAESEDVPVAANQAAADAAVIASSLVGAQTSHLTLDNTSGNHAYEARTSFGDRTSSLYDNWIMPHLVYNGTTGTASWGYAIRLYHGDPGSSGVRIYSTDHMNGGDEVAWGWSYTDGVLIVSDNAKSEFLAYHNDQGLWASGYRYLGDTLEDWTSGDTCGWTADGTQVYTTDFTDHVGIGVQGPSRELTLATGYQIGFESGSGVDVVLYRSTANELRTDDNLVVAGGMAQIGTGTARLRPCTIGAQGGITTTISGNDMMLNADNDTSPLGEFIAEKVWNATYNDYADFQELAIGEQIVFGLCYYQEATGVQKCNKRCQMGVMGIASNTFGFAAGSTPGTKQIPLAVSGWVLAYVDKEYAAGTPLTNQTDARLTEMTMEEKNNYPERLIAIYQRPEHAITWGNNKNRIDVDGRHWVKVK